MVALGLTLLLVACINPAARRLDRWLSERKARLVRRERERYRNVVER